jgi:flagellar biosynthetic protein FliO
MASASTLILFVRLILSLTVVIGLMWVAANVLRKRGFTGVASRHAKRGPEVELIARRPLGRNASIAVVRVGDRSLIVGVTDHQVTNLGDFEMTEIELDEGNTWTVPSGASGSSPATTWKTMLDQMRNRTARH